MSNARQKIVYALGGVLVLALLLGAVNRTWLQPRAALLEELRDATETLENRRTSLENRPRVQREIEQFVDRTLGGDVETVDHRLRTRLNRLGEQLQLEGVTVSTGRPAARGNPASGLFPRGMPELRNEVDFIELEGSISAQGSLEQVIALADRVDAEPWIKRIDSLRIDPRSNGERFNVTLQLTTLFLPGRTPSDVEPPPAYDGQRLARFAGLVERNPFRLPPEPVRVTRQPRQGPPAGQWTVTGVAAGPAGPEAWLVNTRSGESRTLQLGQRINEAVFVAVRGDHAEFEVNQQRLLVAVGERIRVDRSE